MKFHEPCMTLKELARVKGLSLTALTNRSKKVPYPPEVEFGKAFKAVSHHKPSAQYRRAELLKWFDEASV